MRPRRRLRRDKPGTAPGTLVIPDGAPAPRLTAIRFDGEALDETPVADVASLHRLRQPGKTLWVAVEGLGSADILAALGALFGLHTLALEDVLNTAHRPKAEAYEDHLFIVTRLCRLPDGREENEQFSMFIGPDFVLTFQERPHDMLDPVRARLRSGQGRRIRRGGADYLGYAILDTIIDSYFPVLESYGDRLDALEDEAVGEAGEDILSRTHILRRELQQMRHAAWPLREAVSTLMMDDIVMTEDTKPFLRDCYDHVIHLIDITESFRERAAALIEIYLSGVSNRLNDVMRVLTIIATIFMPLSFIAGVYGMNFNTASPLNMPELDWRYGYLFALGLMAAVAAGFLLWFRRRGWLGGTEATRPRRRAAPPS